MISSPIPIRRRRATLRLGICVALLLPAAAQTRFRIVEETQSWTSVIGSSSEYIAAQAVPGATRPVVMAGNFDTAVNFPADVTVALTAVAGADSVFAGVLDYDVPSSRWEVGNSPFQVDKLEPRSTLAAATPTSLARDLAVVDRGEYYLTGLIDDATFFRTRTGTDFHLTSSSTAPPQRGWVALGNSGTFSSAHHVSPDLQPHAVATDVAGTFLVLVGQKRDDTKSDFDGDDGRAHWYALPFPAAGTPLPAPDSLVDPLLDATDLNEVTVTSDGRTWVGGTKSGTGGLGGASDVWLGEADFAGDQILANFRAGSEGTDRLFAMERGAHGEVYVAFTAGGRDISFGALTYDLDAVGAALSTHAFVGLIKSDGTPGWLAPLGLSQTAGGTLVPVAMSVDAAGHAYVAYNGSGTWQIEGVNTVLTGSGQITMNGKGRVIDGTPTPSLGTASGGAVPDVESRLVLGRTGLQSAIASLESVDVPQTSHFIRWVNPTAPGNTLAALSALVTATGGQVHDELDYAAFGTVGVGVWVTPNQLRALEDMPVIFIVQDPLVISPDEGGFGEVADPGWGLARLLDPWLVEADGPAASYYFPSGHVTGDPSPSAPKKVRVYVVDKGLAAAEPFVFHNLDGLPTVFDGANGLNVDALVHPVEDGESVPDTVSNHPRQVVHLLAAADLGAGQGTALEIIPVDMYSGASPEQGNSLTYASYVSHAVLECLSDAVVRDLSENLPTMIVIASSGQDPQDQVDIGGALDQALAQGVPVVLSAGNSLVAALAEDFVPAMHGDKPGVITVGATAFNNNPPANPTLEDLNPLYTFGVTDPGRQIVSLYAPGGSVDTGFGAASGTSFSCALVAGLVANHLSFHPQATPAQVEQALVQTAVLDPDRDLRLARSACSFRTWLYQNGLGTAAADPQLDPALDSDADGDADLWEFLGGSDPLDDGVLAGMCWPVPLAVEAADDLEDWEVVVPGPVLVGEMAGGLRELRFTFDLEPFPDDRCFFRFDFGLPESP
jgi:hypothetical protein